MSSTFAGYTTEQLEAIGNRIRELVRAERAAGRLLETDITPDEFRAWSDWTNELGRQRIREQGFVPALGPYATARSRRVPRQGCAPKRKTQQTKRPRGVTVVPVPA